MPVGEDGDGVDTEDMKDPEAIVLALAKIKRAITTLNSLKQKSAFLKKWKTVWEGRLKREREKATGLQESTTMRTTWGPF